MVWELDRARVFWEMHDGVIDEIPRESTERLRLCLQHRDSKRQFVYVKPNLSATRSRAFIELARQERFLLLTCSRWSTYSDVLFECCLYTDRERLRRARQRKNPRDILFLGSSGKYSFDRSFYDQPPYEYGIAGYDARALNLPDAPASDMFDVDRSTILEQARTVWGSRFHTFGSLNPGNYIEYLYGRREPMPAFCFQPHGVGLRHSIYECMMLGVPSIIPECSYLDDITRKCNIIYSGELPVLSNRRIDLEHACVESFEAFMTPQAIVSSVFNQLQQHNLL